MNGVKGLRSKLRASENTLSLAFNYREIDQNSGNLPKLVSQKSLLTKFYYITHSKVRVSDIRQVSLKIRK